MSDRWAKRQRMEWIQETLRIFGFINREHLMRKFEISMPQAAKDFSDFQKIWPDAMEYDLSQKKYVAKGYRN